MPVDREQIRRWLPSLLLALSACGVSAQSGGGYTLASWAVDGGGGQSKGGGFTVDGSVALPETATLSGGRYRVAQGVWRIEPQGAFEETPTIGILPSQGGLLLLQWPYPATGFVLQWTDRLDPGDGSGVWYNWEGAAPALSDGQWQVPVSPSTGGLFFRLFKP